MEKEKLKLLIQDKNLFPAIPLQGYKNIPTVKWSMKENRIKSIEEYEKYSNKNCTGFSLLTGDVSGVMVIDLDVGHADGINGIDNFNEFIENLATEDKDIINNTFSVRSPNGGIHLYFKYRRGLKNKAEYLPGVDIRTDGGIITLPYTKRKLESGVIKEYEVLNNSDVKEMPKALFDKLKKLLQKNKVNEEDRAAAEKEISRDIQYTQGARNDNLFKDAISIISKSSIRDIETITAIVQGLNLYKCSPPLDIDEVANITASIIQRLNPCYCDSKGMINAGLLAEYILKDTPCYTKGNLWYKYNNEKGVYEYLEFKQVQKMFSKYIVNDADKRTATKSKNFAELLMLLSEDAKEVHDEKKYINCLSGVIDIESNKILKHGPKYKTEIQFQAHLITDHGEYQERFNNSEFKKFLYSTLDDESILTLQESWGLMLSPHAKEVQNCFIYKGEGANGKSLTFDIQEALINDNKICGIGLGDFGEPFVISVAEGKHVNIVRDDELSGKTIHKFFKSMICGEPVTVNRKMRDLIRMGFNITFFFGLNRLPGATDKSTGFFRRPIIIPFKFSFGTDEEVAEGKRDKVKDTGLGQRIIENELDIVFTWAYEGLQRVKANRWNITVSKAAEAEMEEYREEVDSAYAFYNERIVKSSLKNCRIEKKKVYTAYLDWCSNNGIIPMNNVQFGRQLKSNSIKDTASNSVRYWLDIELMDLELIGDSTSPFTD